MTSSVYQAIGERGRYSFAFLTRTLNCSIDYVSGRLYPASVSITGPPLLYIEYIQHRMPTVVNSYCEGYG